MKNRSIHRKINNILAAIVISTSLFLLAIPFMPNVVFWWQNRYSNKREQIVSQIGIKEKRNEPTDPTDNRLLIPSALVDEPILTGRALSVISNGGVWLRPNGSTPGSGDNTILVGHRFTYQNPHGALYHLDKVEVGDSIGLRWQGALLRYVVEKVEVIRPEQSEIEEPSTSELLTIYTCTPIYSAEKRLVIIARPEITND